MGVFLSFHMARAFFVGRFQPFHVAHLDDVRKILDRYDKLVIGIGSSQESHTRENPFSAQERKAMLEEMFKIEGILAKVSFVEIPDFNDDDSWVSYIIEHVPSFEMTFSGNDYVVDLLSQKEIPVEKITLIPGISATVVREKIAQDDAWDDLVPEVVRKHIQALDGEKRIKELYR